MKSISVARIEKSNPSAHFYLRKAGLLENLELIEKIPFLAIYRDGRYEGASIIILDEEKSRAKADVAYFSPIKNDELEMEAPKEITSLINEKYGVSEVEINPVKILSR